MAKKPERFIVTTRWRKLSETEQTEEVRRAMQERHTNKTAARKLGTTPGTVAGIRWRNNIASTHATFGGRRSKVQQTFAPKPSAPVKKEVPAPPPKPAPPPPAQKTKPPAPTPERKAAPVKRKEEVVAVEGPKLKMAPQGHECSYRDEDSRQCAYLPMEEEQGRTLDLDRCRLHQRKK